MRIVNQTVPRALRRLGYTDEQGEDIVAYISEHNSVSSAPHLKADHYPVFDTSMGEQAIHYMGHVRMMAAVQPFISGAISKTVNMPEDVTVEEVEQLFVEGWKLGLKAVAIYRNNCKVAQPLSAEKKPGAAAAPAEVVVVERPVRKRLPASAAGPHRLVPRRRLRGLHHGGGVPGRRHRRDLPEGVEAGFDAVRRDGRVRRSRCRSACSTACRWRLRREVRQHALRAERHDERPRHPVRVVAGRLHLPQAGARVPARRPRVRSSGSGASRSASRRRPQRTGRATPRRRAPPAGGGDSPDRDRRASDHAPDAEDGRPVGEGRRRAVLLLVRIEDAARRSCYVCTACGSTSGCS